MAIYCFLKLPLVAVHNRFRIKYSVLRLVFIANEIIVFQINCDPYLSVRVISSKVLLPGEEEGAGLGLLAFVVDLLHLGLVEAFAGTATRGLDLLNFGF